MYMRIAIEGMHAYVYISPCFLVSYNGLDKKMEKADRSHLYDKIIMQ